MGQVTEETCRFIIEYADRDERFPLTVNEMRQLAYLANQQIRAASRTTPDRDAIIEECAKACEMERDALRKNEAVWDAYPNLRPDEEYISEWESSACRGEEYAAAIRTLKTAPTSDKGDA